MRDLVWVAADAALDMAEEPLGSESRRLGLPVDLHPWHLLTLRSHLVPRRVRVGARAKAGARAGVRVRVTARVRVRFRARARAGVRVRVRARVRVKFRVRLTACCTASGRMRWR